MRGAGASSAYRVVPIDLVEVNAEQPRAVFDEEALSALTESIVAHGILSPLVVRKERGRYVLIAGERRLRAAALAGLQEVPVVVHRAHHPARQLELALVENLLRDDLDSVEEARGFARLIEVYGYTQAQVAQAMGKKRATVANTVWLLKFAPRVLEAIQSKEISSGHGRARVALSEFVAQRRVLAQVVRQGLTVRATERLVAQQLTSRGRAAGTSSPLEDAKGRVEGLLERSLGTKVSLRPRRAGGGRLVIDYTDQEHLTQLVDILQDREEGL
jgi:ParB family chromosome partitioning protein